ncbi:thymine dioxygenase [Peniophora sp. CONT]|nr:thymine dioxygenase [Peniophora sp. CONT]
MTSAVTMDASGVVPVVDFGPFLDGTNRQEVADAMLRSFQEIGFVQLVNHSLSQTDIESMFIWSRRFFSLPDEVKQLAPHPASGTHHRGYSAPGKEKVVQHVYDRDELEALRRQAPDVKESFEVGREDNSVMPNIWLPEDALPGFRDASLNFYWAFDKVKVHILRSIALAIGLPENYLVDNHLAADNQLRLLHYPPVSSMALQREEVTRIGAHSDFGSITLLVQDDIGGLEVEDPHHPGDFLPVPPVQGALLVNAGDFLMRWSNDTIRSTIHRVRAPAHAQDDGGKIPERYSIPYFCCADFNTVVDCLPGTWSNERPKRYEPISASQYVLDRLAATY